jgi:hypothetical protein
MKQRQRRKQQKSKRSFRSRPITLYYQRISPESCKALTEEHRYCSLVLGHIHDELSWLQRMAFLATRTHQFRNEAERQGVMMQAKMLARLLFGKLFEFQVLWRIQPESKCSPIAGVPLSENIGTSGRFRSRCFPSGIAFRQRRPPKKLNF